VFFHGEVLEGITFADLHKGDHVEFEFAEDTRGRGPRAGRVRRIES
jgi:cold shock CspA family protein